MNHTLAKSKPDDEPRKNGIPKSELLELKDRLARTEAALTKLMEATKLISDKIDPKGINFLQIEKNPKTLKFRHFLLFLENENVCVLFYLKF